MGVVLIFEYVKIKSRKGEPPFYYESIKLIMFREDFFVFGGAKLPKQTSSFLVACFYFGKRSTCPVKFALAII